MQTNSGPSSETRVPLRTAGREPKMMKAIVYDRYGTFENLALRDIEKPAVKPDEVLVRVRAAGLHIGDCFGVRGAPVVMRMATGLFKPKHGVPGFDLAGEVDAVGENVRSSNQAMRFLASATARVRSTFARHQTNSPSNLRVSASSKRRRCRQRP